ncbi:Metallo-dependent phosphatase-like protein [Cladorrhinum samala]|uniref:Endopolyphosphatase n=1 Tax=Cladorrhinum samala TaxID=585594 RepID=A0AAV9HEZ3_9PEZI|nr:Metallo-dependent phosphatase-like protein [Cladorrhinum samala]
MSLQRLLGAALLCHGVIAGVPGAAAEDALLPNSAPRRLHGRFLHITDIHPDQFYKVHSSTDEDSGCHKGEGPAGPYGAETSDCDSPFALVNATFDWIEANLKDKIDFIVWTGDSARHDRDDDLPRSQEQVLGTNRWVADKFAELFSDPKGNGLSIPIVPTFGNNDILPHNILLPGPNRWLQTYTHIWRHFIPEEQRHSFEYGGWFNVEVIPNKLAVFSVNTLYFFDRNAGVDGCADPAEPGYKQLEWMRVQLEFMRKRGMKAILMGHVPPARTDSKKLWDETCWQKYTLWMHQFRDVVVAGLYGHMNIDHFLVHDTHDIDIAFLSGLSDEHGTREDMDDELTIQSGTDYLMELRDDWSKLKKPPALANKSDGVGETGRRKKGGKRQDPWGERYVLSLVGPSIVPTYFPTLRVLEYNTTGLENVPVWHASKAPESLPQSQGSSEKHLDLRRRTLSDLSDFSDSFEHIEIAKKKKNKKKKGGGKKKHSPGKHKKPHDPNLYIPPPPAKSSPPGPAYSQQPLSLTGYTQYFANLTHINNLNLTEEYSIRPPGLISQAFNWLPDWLLKWRNGKHGGKKPTTPKPDPREFSFEVEYSTFDDKIYKLGDLTVNSFVELAYRIGQTAKGHSVIEEEIREYEADDKEAGEVEEWGSDDDDDDDDESDNDDEDEEDEDVETQGKKKKGGKDNKGKKGKKGGHKKKKKKKKLNKTWLHFLAHAFVGTLDEEELKKYS